ncbi:MAG: FIST signal transduction protein [Thermoanaerobaculia bacterium]
MKSEVLRVVPRAEGRGLEARRRGPKRPPDVVLAFLPPGPGLATLLGDLVRSFEGALLVGCEAVTQFAGDELTAEGAVQLFWFEEPAHGARLTVIRSRDGGASGARNLVEGDLEEAAAALEAADAAFLLADGLRVPAWEVVERLETFSPKGRPRHVAGGLASQMEPIGDRGSRVFVGTEILDRACLLVTFHGVEMDVEVVRGWDPASPIFTVTDAEGSVLRAIDGEGATDWFRRFFTVDGELAPMPEAAHLFPLIIEGPRPERRDLYRSMQSFDEPPGAVTFWGDLRTGDMVRLGMGNDDSLLETAARLPERPAPEAAVLYSCVGRQAVLGGRARSEVATIHGALRGAALSGFFTFGEIGPAAGGDRLAFYNQTAVLALLRERAR